MHMAKLVDSSKDKYDMKAIMEDKRGQIEVYKKKAMLDYRTELEYRSIKIEDWSDML